MPSPARSRFSAAVDGAALGLATVAFGVLVDGATLKAFHGRHEPIHEAVAREPCTHELEPAVDQCYGLVHIRKEFSQFSQRSAREAAESDLGGGFSFCKGVAPACS